MKYVAFFFQLNRNAEHVNFLLLFKYNKNKIKI